MLGKTGGRAGLGANDSFCTCSHPALKNPIKEDGTSPGGENLPRLEREDEELLLAPERGNIPHLPAFPLEFGPSRIQVMSGMGGPQILGGADPKILLEDSTLELELHLPAPRLCRSFPGWGGHSWPFHLSPHQDVLPTPLETSRSHPEIPIIPPKIAQGSWFLQQAPAGFPVRKAGLVY